MPTVSSRSTYCQLLDLAVIRSVRVLVHLTRRSRLFFYIVSHGLSGLRLLMRLVSGPCSHCSELETAESHQITQVTEAVDFGICHEYPDLCQMP